MKQLNLTVVDRIANVKELVPQKGTMTEIILIKSILQKTELTAKEISDYGLEMEQKDNGGAILKSKLNPPMFPPDTVIEFEDGEIELLKKGVNILDKESRITMQNLKLCQDIMELFGNPTK